MAEPFQNRKEEKVENESEKPTAKKDRDRVANELAKKPGKAAHEDEKTEDEFTGIGPD